MAASAATDDGGADIQELLSLEQSLMEPPPTAMAALQDHLNKMPNERGHRPLLAGIDGGMQSDEEDGDDDPSSACESERQQQAGISSIVSIL